MRGSTGGRWSCGHRTAFASAPTTTGSAAGNTWKIAGSGPTRSPSAYTCTRRFASTCTRVPVRIRTFGWVTCEPVKTRGKARRNAGFDRASTTQTSRRPSFITALGRTFIPPPVQRPFPISTSIPSTWSRSSPTSIENDAGENRDSVLIKATRYVPVAPTRIRMPFAVSFTSESKPALAMFTRIRRSAPVVTSITSRSTVFGLARSWIACFSLAAPIALAKSSPVPDGRAASAAPVPRIPFAASDTLPSPPSAATIRAPPSAASRASRSRSGPDSDTLISWGTRSACRPVVTSPISLPAFPCPAVGFATTTSSGASDIRSGTGQRGLLDDPGGVHRLGVLDVEVRHGVVGRPQEGERPIGHLTASVPFEVRGRRSQEGGLSVQTDRLDHPALRGQEPEHARLVEPLVAEGLGHRVALDGRADLPGVGRGRLEVGLGALRDLLPGELGDRGAEVREDDRGPTLGHLTDLPDLGGHQLVPGRPGLAPLDRLGRGVFVGALGPEAVRQPHAAPEEEQAGDDPRAHLDPPPTGERRLHRHGCTPRRAHRLPRAGPALALDRHPCRPQRPIERLTMIAAS